jgi:predicted Zn-ribbon and HTH transcriptional regulator
MSKVTDSLKSSIIGRKFSREKVKKTCWNCGYEWEGLKQSFCPRCKGGRLTPEKYVKLP